MRAGVSIGCKVKAKICRDRRAQARKCETLSVLHPDPHSHSENTRS